MTEAELASFIYALDEIEHSMQVIYDKIIPKILKKKNRKIN